MIINIGLNAWLARCKDQATSFAAANAGALAMATGACGDYAVRDPVAHLNGLAALPIGSGRSGFF
jgi:hypothetical protein